MMRVRAGWGSHCECAVLTGRHKVRAGERFGSALRVGIRSELAVGGADWIGAVWAATLGVRAGWEVGRLRTLEARARELKGTHVAGARGRRPRAIS